MTIRPKTSEMSVGRYVEIIILCFDFVIVIEEHCHLNPSGPFIMDMGLLGHLNWDKNVSYDDWAGCL